MQTKLDSAGRPFAIVTVARDGIVCETCPTKRVIRVRENAAQYSDDAKLDIAPTSNREHVYRCRDCMLAEPITQHNEEWRKAVKQ